MLGALKSVSVERGHDPREYSLVAFGGAGPLHACSLGSHLIVHFVCETLTDDSSLARLCQSYPAIVPPSPGGTYLKAIFSDITLFSHSVSVLCALGDMATNLRHEVGRTYIRNLADAQVSEIVTVCRELEAKATAVLESQGITVQRQRHSFQADMRYAGQALNLSVDFDLDALEREGFATLRNR